MNSHGVSSETEYMPVQDRFPGDDVDVVRSPFVSEQPLFAEEVYQPGIESYETGANDAGEPDSVLVPLVVNPDGSTRKIIVDADGIPRVDHPGFMTLPSEPQAELAMNLDGARLHFSIEGGRTPRHNHLLASMLNAAADYLGVDHAPDQPKESKQHFSGRKQQQQRSSNYDNAADPQAKERNYNTLAKVGRGVGWFAVGWGLFGATFVGLHTAKEVTLNEGSSAINKLIPHWDPIHRSPSNDPYALEFGFSWDSFTHNVGTFGLAPIKLIELVKDR